MKHYATVTVIGRDKTGVIARITAFLFAQKANIEALEEQVTRGQFSMTLQASWQAKALDRPAVDAGLHALGQDLGMQVRARFTSTQHRQRGGILVSKEPHCLEGLIKAFKNGTLPAEAAVVISNHGVLEPLAKKAGLPFHYLSWEDRDAGEKEAVKILDEHGVDFVMLARFMKILSPQFVWHYKNKIINIHPSLLPCFPGAQAYRQAYEHGVKIAGVTAHFVDMHLDEGPIIAQASFAVKPGMTLPQIIAAGQKLETTTLVKAVGLYLRKRLDVHWGTVREV